MIQFMFFACWFLSLSLSFSLYDLKNQSLNWLWQIWFNTNGEWFVDLAVLYARQDRYPEAEEFYKK
jgi:hypothetical protein